jgi:hypothetical protein
VAAPRDVIPDQNVAIQAVVSLAIEMLGFRNPIVVIGGAHFVRIAVVEWMANADDEDGGHS